MTRKTFTGAALAAAIAFGGLAGPASAQEDMPYSEDTLQSFAEAVVAVEAVRQDYVREFQATEDEGERRRIAERVQAEMIEAVRERPDITLETYNEIAMAAQRNEDLARVLVEMVRVASTDVNEPVGEDRGDGTATE